MDRDSPSCTIDRLDCRNTRCCSNPKSTCFEKDHAWAECKPSCVPGVDKSDAPQFRTPWSCKTLDGKPPVCAADGQDCRSTKCCSNPSSSCFQKDPSWAECKARCVPGLDMNDAPEFQTPWSCNRLGEDSSQCSADGQDCRRSKCCINPDATCFEKDDNWGECKVSCVPGLDMGDAPKFRTPWTCKRLEQNSPVCSADGQDCRHSRCCSNPASNCFAKDHAWAECKASCVPGVDMNDAPQFRTPWSCQHLDGKTRVCSADGHDCRATMCCSNPASTCFEKDHAWGECKATCVVGVDMNDAPEFRTPWSCNRLETNAVVSICSAPGQDCRSVKCCSDPLSKCFEKDQHWGQCKRNCTAGLDMSDEPQWRTPWSCKELKQ